ncbi:sensor histidine kinase, partial [bacterium]|nr:sensor histidine kinase [bacterium]
PHAFLGFPMFDPAHGLEKSLEMVVYVAVAIVTGVLVDRERAERREQVRLAGRLKLALEERERIADQLIRSGRLTALGELTAGIAHEIRNPLHALRGTAEILGDELPPSGPGRDMLERHIGEIDRLSRVLDRFLAFAQPSRPALVPLDPALVLRRAVGLVSAQARRDGVDVELTSVE